MTFCACVCVGGGGGRGGGVWIILGAVGRKDYFWWGSFLISTIFGGHGAFWVGVYTIKMETIKM